MTRPTPTDRDDADRDDARCVSAADRTAFALDQFHDDDGETRRAAISRHLLRCPACRADVDAIGVLGARFATFGAGGDWEADLGAALAAERGRRRVRRRAAFSGIAAAAGIVAALSVGLGRATQSPASDAGPVAASTARTATGATVPASRAPYSLGTAVALGRLLAAQAADGRFPAATHVGGTLHDEAATGLAILALVGEGRGLSGDAETTRAVAAAVRWLRTRESGSGRFVPDSASRVRDQAIATAALLEVGAVTGDEATRSSAERGVRDLRATLSDTADGSGWVRSVLARARALATGHAANEESAMGDAFVAAHWPAGLAEGGSALGRTLAVVAHP